MEQGNSRPGPGGNSRNNMNWCECEACEFMRKAEEDVCYHESELICIMQRSMTFGLGKHQYFRVCAHLTIQTVNTAEYRLIFMEFVEQLDDVELSQGYFQQDGATCHTSNESMELIASFFDDRIISRNLWPPRSPDLTTPDFFLWGYLKDRVYATHPQTLDYLKHNITQEIQAIDNRVLQRMASDMERRVELCLMQDIFNICYRVEHRLSEIIGDEKCSDN
ncbi:hypothetical protein ANN_22047 [Periplaneta americana]|uniref:Transposable element Tc3 transposase n=1 Tax=Periplaneta americana TaxID=6978 RepID=A0ABQ8S7A7_PERAM|nr:hypothetical protein ANN_22047 [Periplaneta americana]